VVATRGFPFDFFFRSSCGFSGSKSCGIGGMRGESRDIADRPEIKQTWITVIQLRMRPDG
jgi:hypothetical protein